MMTTLKGQIRDRTLILGTTVFSDRVCAACMTIVTGTACHHCFPEKAPVKNPSPTPRPPVPPMPDKKAAELTEHDRWVTVREAATMLGHKWCQRIYSLGTAGRLITRKANDGTTQVSESSLAAYSKKER